MDTTDILLAPQDPARAPPLPPGTRLAYLIRNPDGTTAASGVVTLGEGKPTDAVRVSVEGSKLRVSVRTDVALGRTVEVALTSRLPNGVEVACFPGPRPWEHDLQYDGFGSLAEQLNAYDSLGADEPVIRPAATP